MIARDLFGLKLSEKVDANSGTKYRISQADPDAFQERYCEPVYQDKMEIKPATDLALSALKERPTVAQEYSLARLKEVELPSLWGEDVVFKIFNDLDLLFFRYGITPTSHGPRAVACGTMPE
ncbi:hypothetical protein FGG08_001890 [Glutinoglossum americanum]|uniref:Uncharacterized protein n=1 Tax=Glutinoglossum americanum TaxID=1670608 RepID=A0A9P8I7E8_9PEZI|nr:hypothetical protein FGG08_001890 [Glutinoglossum americanum]